MALLIAGIDEAGYGPTLGPMCVGLSLWRVESWDTPATSPNLWKLLSPAVTRRAPSVAASKKPSSPIAIADSKLLKRPNDATAIHPLVHLERGVLAALACLTRIPPAQSPSQPAPPEAAAAAPAPTAPTPPPVTPCHPADDAALLSLLCEEASQPRPPRWCTSAEHWYDTDPTPLPQGCKAEHLRIAVNLLQKGLRSASVHLVDMRCRVVGESEFNAIVRRTRSKADVTLMAITEHLARILHAAAAFPGDTVQIVCDRLGGREYYAESLEAMIPGARVVEADECNERSRYWVDVNGRRIGVCFQVEAEQAHLPVAMASMIAKLMRELAMARFNRYWGRRAVDLCGREIKPTAGYSTDARRWLGDAHEFLSDLDRTALVRQA